MKHGYDWKLEHAANELIEQDRKVRSGAISGGKYLKAAQEDGILLKQQYFLRKNREVYFQTGVVDLALVRAHNAYGKNLYREMQRNRGRI